MKRIVYITAQSPLSSIETFILTEMLVLKDLGADLFIIPRDKSNKLFHKEAQSLVEYILNMPWFNVQIAKEFLRYLFRDSSSFLTIIYDTVFKARNSNIAIKNLLILPKSLYLSALLKRQPVSHIHAHRGSTPSTMAYIISRITGIPWSLTLHRFDIYENNILKRKVEAASFVRCISEKGKTDLLKIVGNEFSSKVEAIHMGVEVPNNHNGFIRTLDSNNNDKNFKKSFTFCTPANLVPVKGHKYLLEACAILVQKGINYKCIFCGDGPLKNELEGLIKKRGLTAHVNLYGMIPHDQLMHMYEKKEVDIVILPSINTEKGEFEGIPVALMEAMAFGIPVISTDTGGVPELLGDGSGIMVKEKDSEAIADSIEKLMNDPTYYNLMSNKGREKIEQDFNASQICRELFTLFKQYGKY